MRSVTIYGITSHQARAGSFIEMYRMPPIESIFPIGLDDALVVEQQTAQRLRLKVHAIRRAHRVAGVRPADSWQERDFDETYIAIEPELEELLTLPFKAKLAEAERQAHNAAALRQRIATFNTLPWYRRIWVAIRRTA